MRKLQALVKALMIAGAYKDSDRSFADQGVLEPTGKDLGIGIEVGRVKYDGVIQIEDYPDDAHQLLAFVTAWLQENDPERERLDLALPELDIALNDGRSADVEITVEFEEGLQLVPDDAGIIRFNGKTWSVEAVPVYVAEELDEFKGGVADA